MCVFIQKTYVTNYNFTHVNIIMIAGTAQLLHLHCFYCTFICNCAYTDYRITYSQKMYKQYSVKNLKNIYTFLNIHVSTHISMVSLAM